MSTRSQPYKGTVGNIEAKSGNSSLPQEKTHPLVIQR